MKNKLSSNVVALLLISLMLISSLTLFSNLGYAQPESMTFTSGEKINFTSDTEMTFKGHTQMQFWSGIQMSFGSGYQITFFNPSGIFDSCEVYELDPLSPVPSPCEWYELLDPVTGEPTGIEFHVDWFDPPLLFHIDWIIPGPMQLEPGWYKAERKISELYPCEYFVVHWPEHWWPEPCSWWEIISPIEWKGVEFHVDWTNESCEFHIDALIPEWIPPLEIGVYEIVAIQKIPEIKPCDYFVVEEPPHWWPEPCSWWEILDPFTGEPTGYEFHVDWTNESCEFHIDEVTPENYTMPKPGVPYVYAEKKIEKIESCDWFIIVDPPGFLPDPCSWWEVLDDTGVPTGLEFHVDVTNGIDIFHVDIVDPEPVIHIPPSYTVTVRMKIDIIQPCDWFRVSDPTCTPEPCSWWEILDDTGAPTDIEFHVDQTIPAGGLFHIDEVYPVWPIEIPPTHMLTAEKKIDDIKECDWFKVLDPPDFVPEPCSWWVIIWPPAWAGVHFHVDANDAIDMFHIDDVNGGGPPPPPPTPPPWNVTAIPYEPPPLPWYMKASYPDYVPSGMPDFDQRQWRTYNWTDPWGRWSHCGPCAVANSLFWLDSEFEPNTIPPPTVIDNYPLVQAYAGPPWDDHDPLNVPFLVEHLAYLMDTDGMRTGQMHLGTNVFDMEAGITHYLSWSGVNPLGDVDGDGNVTMNDVNIVNLAFGTSPGIIGWDLRADIWPVTTAYPPMADNIIDAFDLNLVMMNFGMNGSFYEHTVIAPWWDTIVEEVERCQDVVLLIAPWYYDGLDWYRHEEDAHFVTVAGLNRTTWEIVFSDPILDNAEAGGYGDVPVPHIHLPPEPPYITHNDASLVSHDAYHVIPEACPGGPLTIPDYPRGPGPYPEWRWQIEAAVITSPYAIHDVAVTNVTSAKSVLCQGCTGNITVTVENQGTASETFDVTLYANTTIIGTQTVALPSGNSMDLVFTWDATGFSKGNYTLKAVADTVPGEVDTADNTYVDGWIIVSMLGDITGSDGWPDGVCDIRDVSKVAKLFGAIYPDPRYDPNCDIVYDLIIDIKDISTVAKHFGEIDP